MGRRDEGEAREVGWEAREGGREGGREGRTEGRDEEGEG